MEQPPISEQQLPSPSALSTTQETEHRISPIHRPDEGDKSAVQNRKDVAGPPVDESVHPHNSGSATWVPNEPVRSHNSAPDPVTQMERLRISEQEMSLVSPKDRQSVRQMMVESGDGPCGGGIIQNFGMEVNTTMTTVVERIIEPPRLEVGGQNGQIMSISVDPKRFHWNLVGKSVVVGKSIRRWGMIDFTSTETDDKKLGRADFISKLMEIFTNSGIDMSEPVWVEPSSMNQLASNASLSAVLEKVNDEGELQFIICVMTDKHSGYQVLRRILSEAQLGIVTQFCFSSTVNELKDQNLSNIALKINAKLRGSNFELSNRFPCFEGNGHVMFIGADVNHPAAQDVNGLSIAAVAASVNWPAVNRYAARVYPQPHRNEQILNFGTVCLELVKCYERSNGLRPEKIVIFRDGVSEGQFDMVLNEELQDVKEVFQGENYFPTITLIVAQKRHQIRLFQEEHSVGNVSPGTVVDTTITHPSEFDFYLCSHCGSLRTSKPTHYHVLWDEHNNHTKC